MMLNQLVFYDATSEKQVKTVEPFVKCFFDLKKDVKALGFVNANSFLIVTFQNYNAIFFI